MSHRRIRLPDKVQTICSYFRINSSYLNQQTQQQQQISQQLKHEIKNYMKKEMKFMEHIGPLISKIANFFILKEIELINEKSHHYHVPISQLILPGHFKTWFKQKTHLIYIIRYI